MLRQHVLALKGLSLLSSTKRCTLTCVEDVDEEDRRPTQRRRVERAQAGIVDDDDDVVCS